jgi:predicted GIY-YIG superfamily endonuclease
MKYCCYLLQCRSKTSAYQKSYIGYTLYDPKKPLNAQNGPLKRLAEHNSDTKKGRGAKATRGFTCELISYVRGFSTKGAAMSFESRLKQYGGLQQRKNKMMSMQAQETNTFFIDFTSS